MSEQRINGAAYDFSKIEININGRRYFGVTEINYSDSLEPEKVRGAVPGIRGFTTGEYDTEGSITLDKETQYALIDALGDGYGQVPIDSITITYANTGQPTRTDELLQCRIVGFGDEHSTGSEGLTSPSDLAITEILRNGKRLYKRDNADSDTITI